MSLRRATVNVATLRHLWEQFKPSKVDLLVVDVEGNEPRVFDHPLPRPRPRLVHFEHAHLSTQQRRSLHFKLISQGYEFKETGRPPLDKRRPTCAAYRAQIHVLLPPRGLSSAPSTTRYTGRCAHQTASSMRPISPWEGKRGTRKRARRRRVRTGTHSQTAFRTGCAKRCWCIR